MTNPQTQSDEVLPEIEATTEAETAAPLAEADGEMTARIAELEKQLAETKDRLLRELAEAENTRRRSQKEREDMAKYAVSNFAKEMLGVSDNFARALAAAPGESADPAIKNLMTGIDMTDRQLQASLERFGIKKMELIGQPFNPNFHQVMMEVDSAEYPAGTIVQVLQSGYMIHDRLLREALVAVSKGAPAASQHVDTSV